MGGYFKRYPDNPFEISSEMKRVFVAGVDLDETLLSGTVYCIEDDEKLKNTPLNQAVLARIMEVKNRGGYALLITRNNQKFCDRFFKCHPEVQGLFNYVCPCPFDSKAAYFRTILHHLDISPEHALFIDDNPGERADVEETFDEDLEAIHPDASLAPREPKKSRFTSYREYMRRKYEMWLSGNLEN